MFFIYFYVTFSLSLKPIFYASDFWDSPVYVTITNSDLYPECPKNINQSFICSSQKSINTTLINKYPDCVSKLLQVQLNISTGEVEELSGIKLNSSSIGDYSNIISFKNFVSKAHDIGYLDNDTLFSVGYNYFHHPVTSESVYISLKAKIEETFEKKSEKSVLIGFGLGSSFFSIFVSNYSKFEWVQKYIDSVIFIAPSFGGVASFQELFLQKLEPFKSNNELKKSIMRMPGLHIQMPNYVVFGDRPVVYNLHEDFDQDNATRAVEFLKSVSKMDDEAEKIFKSSVEKHLSAAIPEPPIPSLIIYNDKVETLVEYAIYRHQVPRVVSKRKRPGDGKVTSEGAEYACSHWERSKCVNIHDSSEHSAIISQESVISKIFEYIESDKNVNDTPKKALFLVSGFQGSPIYATVTDSSKVPMCPHNLDSVQFFPISDTLKELIDDKDFSLWLSGECLAMLTRVELDESEKFVTYAPGIHLKSSRFGEYDQLLSYNVIIDEAFKNGYTLHKDVFGVGYNFMLHPLMSAEIYEELKENIERYYNKTGVKSIITGHSQGTSFVEIFITDFVTKEWAKKYVDGVIFYAPAFAGWGTYGRSVNGAYGSGFPDDLPSMQTSTARMPGCHIMMPNEGVFGEKTVIKDFPNKGDESNASFVAPLLKQLNRMDDTAFKIFQLTDKFRKPPLPEPPVPSLVIYNSYVKTGNGYTYDEKTNTVTYFNEYGDGTVSCDGPKYACEHWKNVKCYDYESLWINHQNIQENQMTIDLTFEFISEDKPYIDSTPTPSKTPEPTLTESPTQSPTESAEPTLTTSPEQTPTESFELFSSSSIEPTLTASSEQTLTESFEPISSPSTEPTLTASFEQTTIESFEPTFIESSEQAESYTLTESPNQSPTTSPSISEQQADGKTNSKVIIIIIVVIVFVFAILSITIFIYYRRKNDNIEQLLITQKLIDQD